MQVDIHGPRGGNVREEYYIEPFALACMDILGLTHYAHQLNIIVSNTFRHYPDAIGLCYGEDIWITIELARKDRHGDKANLLLTLAHEFIHVRQYIRGENFKERPARKHEEFVYDLALDRM